MNIKTFFIVSIAGILNLFSYPTFENGSVIDKTYFITYDLSELKNENLLNMFEKIWTGKVYKTELLEIYQAFVSCDNDITAYWAKFSAKLGKEFYKTYMKAEIIVDGKKVGLPDNLMNIFQLSGDEKIPLVILLTLYVIRRNFNTFIDDSSDIASIIGVFGEQIDNYIKDLDLS